MININIQKPLFGSSGEMDLHAELKIKEGEFLAVSGRSGSGKTTLLRVLAGLEDAKGEITLKDESWLKNGFSLPPQKREIGFVFQDYALFTNMSVEENLLFAAKDRELAKKLLEMTELSDLAKRAPATLSGGQKQRVSLCRALMKRPKLLLLDEPLSALDAQMRIKLQNDILSLHREFGTTTIMVSHDTSEMYRLANRVIIMDAGKIVNDGVPKDVLLRTSGSQKFSFEGELLDIIKVDVIYVAIVSIGQQLVEVVISESEAAELEIGRTVNVGTKAFTPTISL